MKILKILLVIVLVLLVLAGAGLFVFLKTFDINRYKDQITRQAGDAIGRNVTLDEIQLNVSLSEGVGLKLSGIVIPEHQDFGDEPFLQIDSAFLNLELMPLLKQRRVVFSELTVRSPRVSLVRDKSGRMNVQTLIPEQKPPALAGHREQQAPGKIPARTGPALDTEDLTAHSVRILDAAVHLVDLSAEPALDVRITQADVLVENLGVRKPFTFHGKAAFFSEKQNIAIDGQAILDPSRGSVNLKNVRAAGDMSDLLMQDLKSAIPLFAVVSSSSNSLGKLDMTIERAFLNDQGLADLLFNGQYVLDELRIEQLKAPLRQVRVQFDGDETRFNLNESLVVANGSMDSTFRVKDYMTSQEFDLDLTMNGIQVYELIDQKELPAELQGVIEGTFRAAGRGFTPEQIQSSLKGEGEARIKEGRIVDVNILKLVLSKISFVPDLQAKLQQYLPQKYKEKLDRKHTVITDGLLKTRLEQANVFFEAGLNADGLMVNASGKVDFNEYIEATAELLMEKELSLSFVNAAEDLSLLQNEKGLIRIPLTPYRGKLKNFRMYPNVTDLGRKAIQSRGKEELRKALRKVLDIEDQPPPSEPAPDTEPAPDAKPGPSPEEVLIENILDTIPIFK